MDGQLGHLVLDPAQQTLLGGQLLGVLVVLVLPHGHGDGVVEDQGPDEAQDQLQVPVHDGFAVCGDEKEESVRWSKVIYSSWKSINSRGRAGVGLFPQMSTICEHPTNTPSNPQVSGWTSLTFHTVIIGTGTATAEDMWKGDSSWSKQHLGLKW